MIALFIFQMRQGPPRFCEAGEGEPVILTHGYTSNATNGVTVSGARNLSSWAD